MRLRALRGVGRLASAAILAAASGCYDFHVEGPEDPEPLDPPRLVSVTVEYRQPAGCLNAAERCDDPVVFFGSWLPALGVTLRKDPPGGLVWRGRLDGVPVNFPPRGEAYRVRIFDPHIFRDATAGITANRITLGGEQLTKGVDWGTQRESALVYVDENGIGHNPF